MVGKMIEERYDGLSDKEKYERAIKEYKVRDRDAQVMPDEDVEFYMPISKEVPECMARGKYQKDPTIEIRHPSCYEYFIVNNGEIIARRSGFVWKVPYKVVEEAIQKIKEKGIKNCGSITNLLIDLAKEEQREERERWNEDLQADLRDYEYNKERYEERLDEEEVRGQITREGSLQLGFGVYDEQELCNAFIEALQSKNNK